MILDQAIVAACVPIMKRAAAIHRSLMKAARVQSNGLATAFLLLLTFPCFWVHDALFGLVFAANQRMIVKALDFPRKSVYARH